MPTWTREPSPFDTAFARMVGDRCPSPTETCHSGRATPANDYFDDWSDVMPESATG